MSTVTTEISVRGKVGEVPALLVEGTPVVSLGRWLKVATIKDEDYLEPPVIENPALFIKELKASTLKADLFTFSQRLPETTPRYAYHHELDNAAVIPITTYDEWWKNRLTQVCRKNVRRAAKRGVEGREAGFDDELVRGIVGIYNESPTRQGRPFWHYGKSFEAVKEANATYQDRSVYIGAYHGEELIGYLKMVEANGVAGIMQIISKKAHEDKRPTNVLFAQAVELCEQRGFTHLMYGKYVYGNEGQNPLTEFKRRNGFEKVLLPKYYIPLTLKGALALKLKLHLGPRGMLPERLLKYLLAQRAKWYRSKSG